MDLYPKTWLNLTLEILGCGREMIHELSNFRKSITSIIFLTEKRYALDSDGFNSTKPVGPVFLTGWMAVDRLIRNTGPGARRRILDYAHITLLQIYVCEHYVCTHRSVNSVYK